MSQAEAIVEFLGGEKALLAKTPHKKKGTSPSRRAPSTEIDFIELVREGLPYCSLERATDFLSVSVEDLSKALRLTPRTLARRRHLARLNQMESERMLRLARVIARAVEVLGEEGAAREWIQSPNAALGGRLPLNLLDTDIGAEAVLNVLGRIEHGVVS